ncbi:REC8 meiotic recombination protein b [Brachionichthys hirsutus]|uniref:REC8 meiotic recombination protein b n=1 Tax=Brachionichthys hirsutus TaxID=412623 RepID=UPI003604A42E
MFYYPQVLHRRTGCFSTIWLAATKGMRITRRELLRVNVKLTCSDIMDYLTARVPPPQPSLPKPLFSLYLSSQLQYGVVLVFHRQCGFLLEEVQQTIGRLLRFKNCTRIDLAEGDRLAAALEVPDNMCALEEAEGAQDPFFGSMTPGPRDPQQPAPAIEEASSQRSLLPSGRSAPEEQGFQSPPAAITLRDKEQLLLPAAEQFEGDDLAEATAREIELLLDQPDHFGRDVGDKTGGLDRGSASIDQLKDTHGAYLLDGETRQPGERPPESIGRETTPTQVPMPTPPSGASGKEGDGATGSLFEEVDVAPRRRPAGGRRRQLVFADPEMQISDGAMTEQIRNPLAETLDLSAVLVDLPPEAKRAAPAQLFSAPCGPLLHADLLSLWKQHALLTSLWKGNDEESTGEEEQDREILRTEGNGRLSSLREISIESGLQGSSAVDAMLETSKEDRSISDVITPVSRWSPREEARPPMEAIVEENIQMPEAQAEAESGSMKSWIALCLQRFGEVTFGSLVPPEASRSIAAHTLCKLLELLSAGEATAQQAGPYGDIAVRPAALRGAA